MIEWLLTELEKAKSQEIEAKLAANLLTENYWKGRKEMILDILEYIQNERRAK